jgi:hypothetical protein
VGEGHQHLNIAFQLGYGRYITGIETGMKLVEGGWYYLKYLPGWYWYNKAGIVSARTGLVGSLLQALIPDRGPIYQTRPTLDGTSVSTG